MNEEKINNLDVSDKWKNRFLAIARAKPINFGLVPKFENQKELNFSTNFNFLALFFTIFYYIAKGMWKKGISIFVINFILLLIFEMIAPTWSIFVTCGIAGLCAGMANFDFYRFKVLDEGNFWW